MGTTRCLPVSLTASARRGFPHSLRKACAWIGNSGGAGIGAVSDAHAAIQEIYNPLRALILIMGMTGYETLSDAIMGKKLHCMPRILACDNINRAKDSDCSICNIFKVPYRGCNHIQVHTAILTDVKTVFNRNHPQENKVNSTIYRLIRPAFLQISARIRNWHIHCICQIRRKQT